MNSALPDKTDQLPRFRQRSHERSGNRELPKREHRHRQADAPAHEPDHHHHSAFADCGLSKIERSGRADEVDGCRHLPHGRPERLARLRLLRIDDDVGAAPLGRFAFSAVDVGDRDGLLRHAARQFQRHEPPPAETHDQERSLAPRRQRFAQR